MALTLMTSAAKRTLTTVSKLWFESAAISRSAASALSEISISIYNVRGPETFRSARFTGTSRTARFLGVFFLPPVLLSLVVFLAIQVSFNR